MASIQKRKDKFCVVYYYKDANGEKRQKWETYDTEEEAQKRKRDIETQIGNGVFEVPQCTIVKELMSEYVSLYGKKFWSLSYYDKVSSLIDNYITPLIGNMKLEAINTRYLENLYQIMLEMPAHVNPTTKKANEHISYSTIREMHKLLHSAFKQAVKWDLMEKNPADNATVPKKKKKERDIWTAETVMYALEVCDDGRLRVAINLAFSCSLRLGEILGLTWDCVDISEEAIEANKAFIYINKEAQRVDKKAMAALDGKDVLLVFPENSKTNKTVRVLKTPKTDSSVRKVFLPRSVAYMLLDWKQKQDEMKEILGEEYRDFNLVLSTAGGLPVSGEAIRASFKKLIEQYKLPPVVFHSLRHTSITYKLKLNGGDIKAVQGDSGHSQINMITDVYSHVIDEDRRKNAALFEDAFYAKKNLDPQLRKSESGENILTVPEGVDAELLAKVLTNPEMSALLASFAQALK